MRNVLLTVTFDIDQDSQLLSWAFEADGKPITGQGVETGLLAFQKDDKLSVTVIATSEKDPLGSIHIDGCHLITIPRAFTKRENPQRAGEFPEPSPFNEYGAVVNLGSGECEGHGTTLVKQWQPDVPMQCDNIGRWEMSFVLTTTINRSQGGVILPEQRVFAFDPEFEVGNGQ
jgi:hypothetical protein